MTDDEKIKALNALRKVKDAPEWMQNLNLFILCKTDNTGFLEKHARILAKYGMESEKIVPCFIEIFEMIITSKESSD